jgi:hypothetical protein
MYARVATFEGGEAAQIQENIDEIREQGASGPPEGVPATGFLMLLDREAGKTVAISLFETEEDMRTGDATLNEMSPPTGTMGRRTSVEMFEVALQFSA